MSATAINIEAEVVRRKALPYTRELIRNSDGTWFARVLEFAGCMTEGDTQAEALEMLDDAMDAWISAKLEESESVPDPINSDEYSGKFMVRLPKSLHRDLARRAETEEASLNQFVVTTLARYGT